MSPLPGESTLEHSTKGNVKRNAGWRSFGSYGAFNLVRKVDFGATNDVTLKLNLLRLKNEMAATLNSELRAVEVPPTFPPEILP